MERNCLTKYTIYIIIMISYHLYIIRKLSNFILSLILASEGAFKKLKTEPLTSVGGISASHSGHTPTTATCPTPARRRHRTTFTQVSIFIYKIILVQLL